LLEIKVRAEGKVAGRGKGKILGRVKNYWTVV